jgi:hypothetical protein
VTHDREPEEAPADPTVEPDREDPTTPGPGDSEGATPTGGAERVADDEDLPRKDEGEDPTPQGRGDASADPTSPDSSDSPDPPDPSTS